MTTCLTCGVDNPGEYAHCDSCGAILARACNTCGHSNRPTARFCGRCGKGVASAVQPVIEAPAPQTARQRPRLELDAGELKLVTVMFADIRGSLELIRDLDPEEAMATLEPGLQAMIEGARKYGGTVNRIQGDGIMVLFGAPIAQEDHAAQACLAAWAMLQAIRAMGSKGPSVEIRIGIHSGQVLVRAVANDMSIDYDVVGATAHLARRLEEFAAVGTACLSETTWQLAGGNIASEQLGTQRIKGFDEPLPLYRLLGPSLTRDRWAIRAASRELSGFVGREPELGIIERSRQRAAEGWGQVVGVVGDPGNGKSRFVHEFLSTVPAGTRVLRTAAEPHDIGTPFLLISSLVRAWLDAHDNGGVTDAREKMERRLASSPHRHHLPALRFLLGLVPDNDRDWATLEPVQRRRSITAAVRDVIAPSAGQETLLIVCEDLHWIDPESQVVLDAVVENLARARILLIATFRPSYAPPVHRSYFTLIQLPPLDDGASDCLLCNLLGDGAELAPLRRLLIERTGGTPLFLEETARMLLETGVVSQDAPHRLLRSIADIQIPASVQAVIAARIDALPPRSRSLLQLASVIGMDIPRPVLALVAELSENCVDVDLDIVLAHEFLFPTRLTADISYVFKHALTKTVTYEGLLQRHRRMLHGRVLRAIESRYADRLGEFTERLAEHALKAGDLDRAAHYLGKAGHRANAHAAHHMAIGFFEQALAIHDKLPDSAPHAEAAIEIHLGLRVALASTAELPRILIHLDRAEALALTLHDHRRLLLISVSQANIRALLGQMDQAVEAGLAGIGMAEKTGDMALLMNARFALGQAYSFKGDLPAAIKLLQHDTQRVIDAREQGPSSTTGTTSVLYLCCLANALSLSGLFAQARSICEAATVIAKITGRPYDCSYSQLSEGLLTLTLGDPCRALDQLERAMTVAVEGRIQVLVPSIARFLGLAYAEAGRFEDAERVLGDAILHSRARGLVVFDAWCTAALAAVQLMAGNTEEAVANASAALDVAIAHDLAPVAVLAGRSLGRALAKRENVAWAEAETVLHDAISRAEKAGMAPEMAHCHADLAHLHAAHDQIDRATASRTVAHGLYTDLAMIWHAGEVA